MKSQTLKSTASAVHHAASANDVSSSFVTLHRDGDILYAGVGGELWALDPKSGAVFWHNRLKGFGYGISSILGDSDEMSSSALSGAAAEYQRQAAAAASAGS